MSTLFERAVEATGTGYLALETELRRVAPLQGPDRDAIRAGLGHGDPMARLLAAVLLDWSGSRGGDFDGALAYLDRLPGKLSRTAMGTPSPTGTESYLTLHFGGRVADLLAVRLVKEESWPSWKALAVVFYLARHKQVDTTPALIRFAIETPVAEWRQLAIDAIREMGDPALTAKVAGEMARARTMKHPVPAEVRALGD